MCLYTLVANSYICMKHYNTRLCCNWLWEMMSFHGSVHFLTGDAKLHWFVNKTRCVWCQHKNKSIWRANTLIISFSYEGGSIHQRSGKLNGSTSSIWSDQTYGKRIRQPEISINYQQYQSMKYSSCLQISCIHVWSIIINCSIIIFIAITFDYWQVRLFHVGQTIKIMCYRN